MLFVFFWGAGMGGWVVGWLGGGFQKKTAGLQQQRFWGVVSIEMFPADFLGFQMLR